MRRTVTNAVAGVNVAGLQDSSFQTNHLRHRIGAAWKRVDAIDCGAGAGDGEMIIGAEENSRRVGEASRRRRQNRRRGAKGGELPRILRMRRLVGAGEMAHHRAQVHAGEQRLVGGEARELRGRQAEPRHSGIDVDDCLAAAAGAAPCGDLAEIVEHGDQAMSDEISFAARQQPVEHGDLGLGKQPAQRHRLGEL